MRLIKSEDINLKETPAGERFAVLIGRHNSSGAAKQQTVAMVALSPGKSSDTHFHKEREESYFFVEGFGTADIDGQKVSVKAGDLVFAHAGEKHQFINNGSSDLKYIVFTAPSWVPEDSHS